MSTKTPTKPKSIIELLNEKRADKIPEGWFTLAQLAEQEGGVNPLSGSFKETVNEAARLGILQRKAFKVIVKVGEGSALRPITHYKRTA